MFKTLQATFPRDKDYPERQFMLNMYKRVLDGELYDNLSYSFYDEKSIGGEYIELRKRRPCARYNLCKIVVKDSVSLLFSEGHFPDIEADDDAARAALADLVKETKLNATMIDAATRGSVGSIAMLFRVLNGRMFFDVMETQFLTPEWDEGAPDMLKRVTEKYKIKGAELKANGYTIKDTDSVYWICREWTRDKEIRYLPQTIMDASEGKPMVVDDNRTVTHGLGFVPIVWIKNLPGGEGVDGECTFKDAIDDQIEIEYLLSQGGRGLKYSCDPTLLIKEPAYGDGAIIKGAANAIKVSAEGDAKLLEINGTASEAVVEYAKALREFALEAINGNRSNAEKISVAQSGRAMEMMNQALIQLADRLRISYAEHGLLALLKMAVMATHKYAITIEGEKVGPLNKKAKISLRWPAWYPPTSQDQLTQAQSIEVHVRTGTLSKETGTRVIAADYDIEDVEGERKKIAADQAETEAKEARQAARAVQARASAAIN